MADLIDRQAAIKAIENLQACYNGFSDTYDKASIIGALEEVPSAQPDKGYIEQIKWERDLAIRQLADLGYGLGEKPRTNGGGNY